MGWLSHGRANQDPDASGKESVLARCLGFPPESRPLPLASCLVCESWGWRRQERKEGKEGRRSSVPREGGTRWERQGMMNEVTDGEVRPVRVQ